MRHSNYFVANYFDLLNHLKSLGRGKAVLTNTSDKKLPSHVEIFLDEN